MPDMPELSEAKRALLEKYLRGDRSQASTTASSIMRRDPITPLPPVLPVDPRVPLKVVQAGKVGVRPFFFLHGDWTNNAFFCYPLASNLGTDQPFYALEPYKLDDLRILPSTEEMAAAHIKIMRAVQPDGPYLLGGFCNGGLIAYEMARQLHAGGQRVDLLVLMDSIPARLGSFRHRLDTLGTFLRWSEARKLQAFLYIRHWYKHLQLSRKQKVEDFEFLKGVDPRLARVFPPADPLHLDYPGMFTWATATYEPAFYPGKVTLFWDEVETFRRAWWNDWAQGKDAEVETHIVSGTHITCRSDQIYSMGEQLRTCLETI